MGQFNLASTNSTGNATLIVSAGDPETLILNHSTKNTVLIGSTNAVGSGNLLDATPLDPYASVVVNGQADVWAVAQTASQPCTVYTYQGAINWTPKAVQPNIQDSNSPWTPPAGTHTITLNVPAGAQGLMIGSTLLPGFTALQVTGVQSQLIYANENPALLQDHILWVPVMSDADTEVTLIVGSGIAPTVNLVWIMVPFVSGLVETGQVGDVNILSVNTQSGTLPVSGNVSVVNTPSVLVSNTPSVNVSNTPNVNETNKSVCANQEPLAFNVTLAANATSVLLPASVGVQYFLHTLFAQINASDMMSLHVQDTNGNDLGVFINTIAGTPANAFHPPNPPYDFKGSPIPIGVGVQIKNGGASSEAFVGCLTYSK